MFHGHTEAVSAISSAVNAVPCTGSRAATARRGMPRMMCGPKRSPSSCTRRAGGAKPDPPAVDGNRFGAGS